MVDIPPYFKMLYSREQIAEAAQRLGQEITPWAASVAEKGRDVLSIPILRGGIFFYADLVREIDSSVEVVPVRTWGYDTASKSLNDAMKMSLDDVDPKGRSLLLVDDICDSGRTLALLKDAFLAQGAVEVRSAVLVRRSLEDTFKPEYVGYHFEGDQWLAGYGMEDNDRFRNLPHVYTIEKEG